MSQIFTSFYLELVILFLLVYVTVPSVSKKATFSKITFNTSIDDDDPDQTKSNDPLVIQMQFYEGKLQGALDKLMGDGDSSLMSVFSKYNISIECKGSFLTLLTALMDYEPWAIKMIDSSSKIPEGVLYGTINSFGQYDECLDTIAYESPDDPYSPIQFKGQYCAINIRPRPPLSYDPNYLAQELPKARIFRKMMATFMPAELSIALQIATNRFGYCVPSTCTRSDVDSLTKFLNENLHTNTSVAWCETKEQLQIVDAVQLSVVISLAILLSTSFIISYIDYAAPDYFDDEKSTRFDLVKKVLACFSIRRSYHKFSTNKTLDDRFSFIYGIRFVTHLWVMYAHTYAIQNFMSVGNTVKLRSIPQEFLFQIFINGTLSAETFFFMSGFVVGIFLCRDLKVPSAKSFDESDEAEIVNSKHMFRTRAVRIKLFLKNWSQYIFKLYAMRFWRETPLVAVTICIAILWPVAGSGPIWTETITFFSNNCRQFWMPTLLFFSNYKKPEEMCLLHSWYVSLDFQLYLLAPFIIYLLVKKRRYGISLAFFMIFMGIIGTAKETVIRNYPPVPIFSIQSIDYIRILREWVYELFFRPMLHLSSYIIGILTAYFISTNHSIQLPRVAIVVGLIASTATKFIILFAVYPWNKGESVPGVVTSAAYASLSRPLWSLSLTIDVIFGTSPGSGLLTTLLSWSFFRPLARLTFTAYLFHPLIMMATAASNRAPYAFTHFLMFQRFTSFVLMAYGVAFLLHLVLERPLIEIEKQFFTQSSASRLPPPSQRSRTARSNRPRNISSKSTSVSGNSASVTRSIVKLPPVESIVAQNTRQCNLQLVPINTNDKFNENTS